MELKQKNFLTRIKDGFVKMMKGTNVWRIVAFVILLVWGFTYLFGLGWAFLSSLGEHNALSENPMAFPVFVSKRINHYKSKRN